MSEERGGVEGQTREQDGEKHVKGRRIMKEAETRGRSGVGEGEEREAMLKEKEEGRG